MTESIAADSALFEEAGGRIRVSQLENREGLQCWIHDLEVPPSSAPTLAPRLMARARRQAGDWGFEEVFANVANARLGKTLCDHGWTLEQVILKGRT